MLPARTPRAPRPPAAVSSAASPSVVKASSTLPLKKLVLLRHAESENRSQTRDHDRPLSPAGRQQAVDIAAQLKASGWIPDLILASNARRTRQTLEEMSSVILEMGTLDTHFYGSLYTVAALDGQTRAHMHDCLLEVVDDTRHQCVLLVGHNKGWEEAASSFAAQPIKLRTASAALLQAKAASWADALADGATWQLAGLLAPTRSP